MGRIAKPPAGAKRKADAAAAKAKRAGAVGRAERLTRVQRQLRDSAIMARLYAGHSARQAAAEFGITQRAVEQMRVRFREQRSAFDEPSMEVVEGLARTYANAATDLQAIAAANVALRPAVAVNAIRVAMDIWSKHEELLSAAGQIPTNLSIFRAESELRQLAVLMMERLPELDRGEISGHELAEWIRDEVLERASGQYEREVFGDGGA